MAKGYMLDLSAIILSIQKEHGYNAASAFKEYLFDKACMVFNAKGDLSKGKSCIVIHSNLSQEQISELQLLAQSTGELLLLNQEMRALSRANAPREDVLAEIYKIFAATEIPISPTTAPYEEPASAKPQIANDLEVYIQNLGDDGASQDHSNG